MSPDQRPPTHGRTRPDLPPQNRRTARKTRPFAICRGSIDHRGRRQGLDRARLGSAGRTAASRGAPNSALRRGSGWWDTAVRTHPGRSRETRGHAGFGPRVFHLSRSTRRDSARSLNTRSWFGPMGRISRGSRVHDHEMAVPRDAFAATRDIRFPCLCRVATAGVDRVRGSAREATRDLGVVRHAFWAHVGLAMGGGDRRRPCGIDVNDGESGFTVVLHPRDSGRRRSRPRVRAPARAAERPPVGARFAAIATRGGVATRRGIATRGRTRTPPPGAGPPRGSPCTSSVLPPSRIVSGPIGVLSPPAHRPEGDYALRLPVQAPRHQSPKAIDRGRRMEHATASPFAQVADLGKQWRVVAFPSGTP